MSNWKRFAVVMAVLVSVALPVMVGCNLLQYQFEINNLTSYDLMEVNITADGAQSWGSNDLSAILAPGGSEDIKGFAAGEYMVRGVFDVADAEDDEICGPIYNDEYLVYNTGIEVTTTNVAIDYSEDVDTEEECTFIYGDVRYII
ncbi:MAG: hypothetical protein K1Y02_10610 [Candidatus Hydrogenedentes bacterium]|nr:hypothetical protein [Candidatus Hydrogenedentota bacterium]